MLEWKNAYFTKSCYDIEKVFDHMWKNGIDSDWKMPKLLDLMWILMTELAEGDDSKWLPWDKAVNFLCLDQGFWNKEQRGEYPPNVDKMANLFIFPIL